jgi:hypothetical protein
MSSRFRLAGAKFWMMCSSRITVIFLSEACQAMSTFSPRGGFSIVALAVAEARAHWRWT